MDFRLLGPVEVWSAGVPVDAGPPRQRCLLAALVVDAGRPVTIDVLVQRVWGDAPPGGGRHTLHVHVARLRKALQRAGDAPAVVHRDGTYLLDVDPERTDVHRFRLLVEEAAGRPDAQRVALLRQALDLWRGEPLAGLAGDWAARTRERWEQHRLATVADWARAELALGHAGAVISEVQDLADEFPLAEPMAAVLIAALHAAGRGAEALDRYAETRRRLVEELNTEPGPELRDLHRAILRGQVEPAPEPAPVGHVPAQLPPDVPGLTGRAGDLDRLDAIMAGGRQRGGTVLAVLSGAPGVGKTALAVHWAHRAAGRFPDGQLYVNLNGFAADGTAVAPEDALRLFLDALGVPSKDVPAGLAARAALYRGLLSGRRTLVVLDNARDAGQVRPLLPGSPGCPVVVTSRNQLPDLVAVERAEPLTVDLLSLDDARDLLARRLGAGRVAVESTAVDEIVDRCARLPLALVIVAARAAFQPGFPLAVLAAELREPDGGGLDAFDGGDPATQVRAVFSTSYRALSPTAATLFRLLGLHGGPDISAAAAASLLGGPSAAALTELTQAHLLTQHRPGRYTSHDLLRAYAAETAEEIDGETRHAALTRLFEHYARGAIAATDLLYPHDRYRRLSLPPAPDYAPAPAFTDPAEAMAWLDGERPNLVAACVHAADVGCPDGAVGLAGTLWRYLDVRGYYPDALTVHAGAVRATDRGAAGRAGALTSLGMVYWRLGKPGAAIGYLQQALDCPPADADRHGPATTSALLGIVYDLVGRHADALARHRSALAAVRAAGNRRSEASTLNNIGILHRRLGEYDEAIACHRQAIEISREIGDPASEGIGLGSLGEVLDRLGRHDEAVDHLKQAISLIREVGDRSSEGDTLSSLGAVFRSLSRFPEALDHLDRALAIAREIGDPWLEAKTLNALGGTASAMGDPRTALERHRAALALARQTEDRFQHANALDGAGTALQALGHAGAARRHHEEALGIYTELRSPGASAGDRPGDGGAIAGSYRADER
jgi:DNA-binding SARP family transcriptional activator/tetratricopeptide (TPR) repeat protein